MLRLPLLEDTALAAQVAVPGEAGVSLLRPLPEPARVWHVKSLIVLADIVAISAAMELAYVLRFIAPSSDPTAASSYLMIAGVSIPVWIGLFFRYRLYRARHVANPLEEVSRIFHASAMTVAFMAAVAFMTRTFLSRSWLLVTFLLVMVFVLAERTIIRYVFGTLRARGRFLWPVVLVGSETELTSLMTMFDNDPQLGYKVVGVVHEIGLARSLFDADPESSDGAERTIEVVRRMGATGVILAASSLDMETANGLVRELANEGIRVELASCLRDIAAHRLSVRTLGRIPVVHVDPGHPRRWATAAKRAFDVVGAAMLLLLFSPLLLVIAVAVKCTSTGPVLFRQERVGRQGEPFPLLKFRSMVVHAEERLAALRDQHEVAGPLFKLKKDPRVTGVGRVIRRFSLDELPQLWNVIRGDMSLIGPRPALSEEISYWSPQLHRRLRVRPGITGMWQVSGRSDASFEDYSRLDIYYVENWSLITDLTIMARTVPAILRGRGAY